MSQVRRLALLQWGDVFEDYLDDIGWSVDDYCEHMTGGWGFGYVEALARQGIDVVIVCVVRGVEHTERRIHEPSGNTIVLLPATRSFRLLRRFLRIRYRYLVGDKTPPVPLLQRLAYHVLPYLATPRRALKRMLVQERCDVLMNQSYEDARFDIAVQTGRQLGIPVFATAQGGEYHRSKLEHYLRPRSFARSAGIIIASRTEAERVVHTYGLDKSKIARVMNPVDDRLWFPDRQPKTRDELGVPRDALLVAWHGRVDLQQKGIDVLLDAWAHVRARMTIQAPYLVLIGSGPDDELLRKRLAASGEAGIVWIDEYIGDRSRMRRILSSADLYVLPSRGEGQPVAPLEAIACGLAVVATDANGVPEIFEEGEASGGVLVPRDDVEALAVAMVEALEDPARRKRLAIRAQARIVDAFSLEAVGSALAHTLGAAPESRKAPSQVVEGDVPENNAHSNGRDQPLVSVIMIFFNVDTGFFREAIDSVFRQTYGNWELLLVDDGSSNGSTDVALRYAQEHPDRVRYLEHEGHENRGMSAARNLGIRDATGRYIGLLDSDDLWLPEKLEKQVAILEEQPEAGIVYGSTWVWHGWTGDPEDALYDRGRNLGVEPDTLVRPPHLVTLFLQGEAQTPGTCSVLMRRELVEDVGGFEESFPGIYEDQAFFYKVCLKAPVFVESGRWDRYRRHLDSACHIAEADGRYDPYEPHSGQATFLNWLDKYLANENVDDPYVGQALRIALRPYRPSKQW